MARDSVAVVAPGLDGNADLGAGTTIAPANGATIAAGGDSGGLLIRVQNTTASIKKATIKAGVMPPAMRQALGDLEFSLTQNQDTLIRVELGRFCQADGSIYVDFEAGMTGKVWAIRAE